MSYSTELTSTHSISTASDSNILNNNNNTVNSSSGTNYRSSTNTTTSNTTTTTSSGAWYHYKYNTKSDTGGCGFNCYYFFFSIDIFLFCTGFVGLVNQAHDVLPQQSTTDVVYDSRVQKCSISVSDIHYILS